MHFNDIAPALVQVLTEEGAFGWQLKYRVKYCEVYAELRPTGIMNVAWECPSCYMPRPFDGRFGWGSPCEFCGTVHRLSVVSKSLRRVVVLNGVAAPRWWRELTPEERLEKVVAGRQFYGRRGGIFNRLLATLDNSGYEPHSSESESDSDDKDGYHVWEPHPTNPDEENLVYYHTGMVVEGVHPDEWIEIDRPQDHFFLLSRVDAVNPYVVRHVANRYNRLF